jgi:Zn finger protein HypA/HybF involved in hydrogenase expression
MTHCSACGNECYEDVITIDSFDYCCPGCSKEHRKIVESELEYWEDTVKEGKTYIKKYKNILKEINK